MFRGIAGKMLPAIFLFFILSQLYLLKKSCHVAGLKVEEIR